MEFMLTLLQAKMQCFGSGFSLRIHMPQIRKMYVKTSDLAGAADDLLGPLALAVYFFDVVLFSFNLYLWFYKAKSFMEKFLAFFWVAAALANLMFISFAASRVAEKVINSSCSKIFFDGVTFQKFSSSNGKSFSHLGCGFYRLS